MKKNKLNIFFHNLKVIYHQNKFKFILTMTIIFISLMIMSLIIIYTNALKPTANKGEDFSFIIEKGDNYNSIAPVLKETGLIKSVLAYKIYIKLNKPSNLDIGIYSLNKTMGVKKIVKTLDQKAKYGENAVVFVIPEGWNIEKIAEYGAKITNNSKEEIIGKWQDPNFINEVINKYWFVSEEIKNPQIKHPLEGYLFPATYYFETINVTPENIAYKMLDQMDKVLTTFKNQMSGNYTIHQILTLSSVVELEASTSEERKGVAGVFYNRLNKGWNLGSDVTTYYGANKKMADADLTDSELKDDNGYNTRTERMAGKLPVGPICNVSVSAIDAVINPQQNNYYYFVSDKNKKIYFNVDSKSHDKTIAKLKKEDLWLTY